jgi:hypothetical protein
MDQPAATAQAVQAGTERREKMKKAIRIGVWAVLLLLAALVLIIWSGLIGAVIVAIASIALALSYYVFTDLKRRIWTAVVAVALIILLAIVPPLVRLAKEKLGATGAEVASAAAPSKTAPAAKAARAADECLSSKPILLSLDEEWKPLNPDHPDALCDLTFAVTDGRVEFDGPYGAYTPDTAATGRTGNKVATKARALTRRAQLYVMLCPRGKGPSDDGWNCR